MSVFGWGSNKFGELCSNSVPIWEPMNINFFEGKSPIGIASGEGHSLVVTESGDVYSFGRGHDGQLGLGNIKANANLPQLVSGLQHECIVGVFTGAVSSYAVTTTGRAYQWGLVHHSANISQGESAIISGTLAGMAADQESVVVIDQDARDAESNVQSNSRQRQLRDIVRESTNQWMLNTEGADAEYVKELTSMGYCNEELDERMNERGQEYNHMLNIQSKRVIQAVPRLIDSLSHVKVVSISAGYAHCIALTENGVMYSCGYNDRGQLGLGHRISSNTFRCVDYMEGKFVIQVACGQQHSICRAINRKESGGVKVGNNLTGCAVYVWGNGVLGQLGLGLLGTSRGKLLPTQLTSIVEINPLGAVDISCGENFTVCLMVDGTVYSWGHSQYNQHGTGGSQGSDYVDSFHYFIPQKVMIESILTDKVYRICCGSNFTVAFTQEGDAYSWGWNAYGVLGQGKGFIPAIPSRISGLGRPHIDRTVRAISAGSNHVLAITSSMGNAWAENTFSKILSMEKYCDAYIYDQDMTCRFSCHKSILSARSSYLRGYLRAAANDPCNTPSVIVLECDAASPAVIGFLMDYIYKDKLSAPQRIRSQLAKVAKFLGMRSLERMCLQSNLYERSPLKNQINALEEESLSTFEDEMVSLLHNPIFADVKFRLFDESSMYFEEIYAHKAILVQLPYFECLLSETYQDSSLRENGIIVCNMDGLINEGMNILDFKLILTYLYSGSVKVLESDDLAQVMSLLVLASHIGVTQLCQLCEKTISLHLNDFPENLENCLDYATTYNFIRLSRQCLDLLELRKS